MLVALEPRAMLSLRSGCVRGFAASRGTRFGVRPGSARISRKLGLPLSWNLRPGDAFTEFVDRHRMSPRTKAVYEILHTEIASVVRNVLGVPSCPVELRGSIASTAAVESSDLDIWVDNGSPYVPELSKPLEVDLMLQLKSRLAALNLAPVEARLALQHISLASQAKGLKCSWRLSTGDILNIDMVFRKSDGHSATGPSHAPDTSPVPEAIIALKVLAAQPSQRLPALSSRFYNGLVRLAWARAQQHQQLEQQHHHHHHQGDRNLGLFTDTLRLLGEYSYGDASALLEDLHPHIGGKDDRLITGEQMKVWQDTAAKALGLFCRYECSTAEHVAYILACDEASMNKHCHPL
jgi:hypothetical protein